MRWLSYGKIRSNQQADYLQTYWRSDSVTRASGLRPGGCGFDPWPSHTKDFKIVLSALSFALSIEEAELVGPVSVQCDWMEFHIMCLMCVISERQHS